MRSEKSSLPVCGPAFFSRFSCMAGDCPLTCCREWSIAVDDFTMNRWQQSTLDGVVLSTTVERDACGSKRIRLDPDYRCPWLNEKGLCRIVLGLGEDMLSFTCATFPRQRRRFRDRVETSLMTGCPAVIDLLWDGEDPFPEQEERKTLGETQLLDDDDRLLLPVMREVRRRLCRLIDRSELPLDEALTLGFYFLREIWEYEPEPDRVLELLTQMEDPEEWVRLAEELAKEQADEAAWVRENNELFLDLGQNYYKERRYPEVLDRLIEAAQAPKALEEIRQREAWRVRSRDFDRILRNVLISDCYGSLLSEQPDLDSMLMNYQWILLRYAGIRRGLLLLEDGANRENVRLLLCVLERMTGFSEADIRETMMNMFDDPRWDTGYAAFLLL